MRRANSRAVPVGAGVGRLHRLVGGVVEAPIDVETLHMVPVALPAAVGEGAHHRAAGVEADEVEAASGLGHGADQFIGTGQPPWSWRWVWLTVSGSSRKGSSGNSGSSAISWLRSASTRRGVVVDAPAQAERGFDAPAGLHHRQRGVGLLHLGGLAHGRVVEADELAGLGLQQQGDAVGAGGGRGDRVGQGLEVAGLGDAWCRVQVNTGIRLLHRTRPRC